MSKSFIIRDASNKGPFLQLAYTDEGVYARTSNGDGDGVVVGPIFSKHLRVVMEALTDDNFMSELPDDSIDLQIPVPDRDWTEAVAVSVRDRGRSVALFPDKDGLWTGIFGSYSRDEIEKMDPHPFWNFSDLFFHTTFEEKK